MGDYEIVAWDWRKPNVIATCPDRDVAMRQADRLDALGLRCYVREVKDDEEQKHEVSH